MPDRVAAAEPEQAAGGRFRPPRTSFVGRAPELAAIAAMLAEGAVVTLTGPGGSGKTRLAQEAVRRRPEEFASPAVWVDLAPLRSGELVAHAVATALGLRGRAGPGLLEDIADALGDRRQLLVLDNCEQVVGGAAVLCEFLATTCDTLGILATSRVALQVPGEHVLAVPPLPVEDEAVRLFADRARAVRASFGLDAANRDLVAEVCRRLDGLPLAIELAVRWIEVLSPSELLPLLNRRFELLSGGARTLPERQQTLRAAVDWSHELLSAPERMLFRRLSVFAGGFTLAAAEHVCSDQDLPASGVVGHLAALCGSSMVAADPQVAGPTRFRLLETLREYGRERLAEAGEAEGVGGRHFAYYGGLAEAAFAERMGGGRRSVAEALDRDRDNVREALDWGEQQDPERTFAIAGTLVEDLRRSLLSFGEIRNRLEQLRPRSTARTSARAYALLAAGIMAFAAAADDEAGRRYHESCDLFEALGDRGGEAWARIALGQLAWGIGDFAGASRELRAAERLHADLGNAFGRHRARLRAAMAELHDPALRAAARAALDEAIEQGPDLGDPFGAGLARAWRGMIDAMSGDLNGAADHFRGAIPLLAEDPLVAVPLFGLARCWVERDPVRAMRLLGAGDTLQPRTGLPKPYALELIARDVERRARSAMAGALADATLSEGRAMSRADALALATSVLEAPATPAATKGGLGALTARESEIARLVAEGHTNRQIAGALTLSVRTVETHVDRCLTKLGFHSRARLASWVRDQEARPKDT